MQVVLPITVGGLKQICIRYLAAQSCETLDHDSASFCSRAFVRPVFSLSVVASMGRIYRVDYFGCDYCAD